VHPGGEKSAPPVLYERRLLGAVVSEVEAVSQPPPHDISSPVPPVLIESDAEESEIIDPTTHTPQPDDPLLPLMVSALLSDGSSTAIA
jgi:chemotaxis signal transduction protein